MQKYLESEFTIFLLGLLAILTLAKLLGKCTKNIGLTEMTGEIIAGILLGPTFLSTLNIDCYHLFFSQFNSTFFNIFFQLSLVLIMFITGLKLDLTAVKTHFTKTCYITFFGMLIPFATGAVIAWLFQNLFVIENSDHPLFVFPLFMGIAYTLSALPVIAKILIEIKVLHTKTGAIIISAALFVDIICWGLLTIITQLQSYKLHNLLVLFGCFATLFLFKKFLTTKQLKQINNALCSDAGLCICTCFAFSILFQSLHLDACLGAFLAGVILNNVMNSAEIKNILSHWVINFFSPIFFVSIGIKIDFLNDFDWRLISIIFSTASLSKIVGCFIGAQFGGIKGIERIIISLALNARGTIGIIFSAIALNLGIISNPTYVALVTVALLTSILSGILLRGIVHFGQSNMFKNSMELA